MSLLANTSASSCCSFCKLLYCAQHTLYLVDLFFSWHLYLFFFFVFTPSSPSFSLLPPVLVVREKYWGNSRTSGFPTVSTHTHTHTLSLSLSLSLSLFLSPIFLFPLSGWVRTLRLSRSVGTVLGLASHWTSFTVGGRGVVGDIKFFADNAINPFWTSVVLHSYFIIVRIRKKGTDFGFSCFNQNYCLTG